MRNAHRSDAPAIGSVSASSVPYLVRSTARVSSDIKEDGRLGRRRWVALIDGQVVGTATAREVADQHGEPALCLSVKVRPEHGSQGVGTHLLTEAVRAFPGVDRLLSLANGDPISLCFAVRHGFVPESDRTVSSLDPDLVARVPDVPPGMRAVTLQALPDLRMLLETQNLAASMPRSRLRRFTMYQLRTDWWDRPDNAPDLSWGLLGDGPTGPVLAAFNSVQVDRERGSARSTMTATHSSYLDLGLEAWVRRRTLNALSAVGISTAWTFHDEDDEAQARVDDELGFATSATVVRVRRRLPH